MPSRPAAAVMLLASSKLSEKSVMECIEFLQEGAHLDALLLPSSDVNPEICIVMIEVDGWIQCCRDTVWCLCRDDRAAQLCRFRPMSHMLMV